MPQVRIINPETGVSQVVDQAEARYYEGYREATPEEIASASIAADRASLAADPLMAASAASAGALRGATAGLSDIGIAAAAGDDGAGLDAMRQDHGVASALGEVGGTLAGSLLLPGSPAALLGRGGSAVAGMAERGLARAGAQEGGLLASMLSRGLGEAAEGGLYGLGSALSDAAVRGDELTAEKLFPEVGLGAALGLGSGAASPLLSRLGKAAARRAEAAVSGANDSGDSLAGAMTLKALGARGVDVDRLRTRLKAKGSSIDEFGRSLSDAGVIKPWSKPGDIAEAVTAAKEESGAALGDLRRRVDEYIEAGNTDARPDLADFFAKLDKRVADAADLPPEMRKRMESAAEQLQPLRDKFEARAGVQRVKGRDRYANAPELGEVEYLKSGMRDESKAYARAQLEGGDVTKRALAREPIDVDVWPDGRRTVADGRHRLEAAREMGADAIRARVRKRTADGDIASDAVETMRLKPRGEGAAAKGAGGGVSFADVQKYRQQIDQIINPPKSSGLVIAAPNKAELDLVRGDLEDALEESLFKAASRMDDAGTIQFRGKEYGYNEAKKLFAHLASASQIVEQRTGNEMGNRIISLTDNIWGAAGSAAGMAGMGPMGLLTGPVAGMAANQIRQRVPSTIAAKLYGRAARMGTRGEVDRVAQDVLSLKLDDGTPLASGGAGVDFGANLARARQETAAKAAAAATPEEAARLARLDDSLARVEAAVERAGRDPDAAKAHGRALGALLSGNVGGSQMGRKDVRKALRDLEDYFPEERTELARAASDSDKRMLAVVRALARGTRHAAQTALADRLPGGQPQERRAPAADHTALLEYARQPAEVRSQAVQRQAESIADALGPGMAGIWMAKAMGIGDRLAAKAPRPLTRAEGGSLTPWAEPEVVHPLQSARFEAYARGLADPIGALEDLTRGRVDRDALDAVRENYPARWAELQAEVQDELFDREDPPTLPERRMLGLVMGTPADPSQSPDFIRATQQSWQAQQRPAKGGDVDPKLARGMATDSQRLEGTTAS